MLKQNTLLALVASAGVFAAANEQAYAQVARDYVYIVGSSTVYPFSTVVAERFGRGTAFRTPKVESTGSGGGFKLFCDGLGVDFPDVTNASRPIKPSELAACRKNGVDGIIEVKIGYDGIVIAHSAESSDVELSRETLFLALAKQVPGGIDGRVVPNPHQLWSDIDPALPGRKIEVLGPPPTSGTRDTFVEMVMEEGCRTVSWIVELEATDPTRFRSVCHTVREDGAYIDAGENDNLIVQKLEANPRAFGIFGFNFLDQNEEIVKGAAIDGLRPDFATISAGVYPISRPLYFYVKKAHVDVIPGLRGFLRELTSERAWGEEGYLADRGLIPMPEDERRATAAAVRALSTLSLARE